ncbi:hypothetical protein ACNOYE_07965 [Nannocystaceae bacterium ST9]
MPQFDPSVIQTHAQRLYTAANAIVAVYTVFGLLCGATLGYGFATLTNVKETAPISLVAGLVVAGLAFAVGQSKSFAMRLEAQSVLCQLQIEANTRAAAHTRGVVAARMAGPH